MAKRNETLVPPPPPTPVPTGALAQMPPLDNANPFDSLFEQKQEEDSGNPFDQLFAQAPQQQQAAPVSQPPPPDPYSPDFSVKPWPLEEGAPPPPVSATDQVAQNFKNAVPGVIDAVGGAIQKVPVLGDVERAAEEAGRNKEAPLAALANIIPGLISIPQGMGNLSNQLTRQQRAGQVPPIPADFTEPFRKTLDSATQAANWLMGRKQEKPIAVQEAVQRPVRPLLDKYPANAGVGMTVGQLLLGKTIPQVVPGVSIPQLAKAPMAKSVAEGLANAYLYGTETNLADQASSRQREQAAGKPIRGLNLPQAAKAGTESLGAGLMFGLAHGAISKGKSGGKAQESSPKDIPDHIEIDGNKVNIDKAYERLEDPNTPPEFKQKINEALNARAAQIAGDAVTATALEEPPKITSDNVFMSGKALSMDRAALDRGLPGASVRTPEKSGLRVGDQHLSVEDAATQLSDPNVSQDVKQAILNAIADDTTAAPRPGEPPAPVWAEGMGPSQDVMPQLQAQADQSALQSMQARGVERAGQRGIDDTTAAPRPGEVVPSTLQPFEGFDPSQPVGQQGVVQSPEAPPAQEIPGQEAGQNEAPRYIAQRSADPTKSKAGYHDIIDAQTGAVHSSSKRTLKQAQGVADNLNAGTTKPTKGHQPAKPKAQETDQADLFERGQPMPEGMEADRVTRLGGVATAKHDMDMAEARFIGAHQAFQNLKLVPPDKLTSTRPRPGFVQEVENLAQQALQSRPDEVGLEIQNRKKYQPEPTELPSDPVKAAQKVMDLYQKFTAAQAKYKAAREGVVADIKTGMEAGELPMSMNVPHVQGEINIRVVPKKGSPLEAEAAAVRERQAVPTTAETNYLISGIKKFLASYKPTGVSQASVLGPLTPKANLKGKRLPGLREAFGGKDVDPATESIAEGATKDPAIKDYANDFGMISRIFTLRRTLDIVKDHDAMVHSKVWQGIAKETIFGRGIKFEPGQEHLVEQSLRMTPEAIRAGEEGLRVFDAKQREYLAVRRAIRQATAREVEASLSRLKENYVGEEMPGSANHTKETLEALHNALTGRATPEGNATFTLFRNLTNAMYDYVFKWNVPYHVLNLLDPVVTGSARAGFMNIAKAKYLLQTDPEIAKFIKSHDAKGPMQQLRAETRGSVRTPKGVEETWYTGAKKGLSKIQNMAPDLPSETWNFQDALAASIIDAGNRTGYEGGGVKYLKDMAGGKLTLEQQVKGYTEALQSTMDITGAGSLGLDKDPLQANPYMRQLVQFASQPYRVARLLSKWKAEKNWGAMGTFLAMQAAFSGRSVLNQELAWAMEYGTDETRQLLYLAQDFLDEHNPISHIPVIGRDLVDKMKVDLIPLFGGVGTNLMWDKFANLVGAVAGRKWDRVGKGILLLGISSIIGGGGAQIERMGNESSNAQKGEKDVYAYPSLPLQNLGNTANRPLDKTTFGDYGPLDAVINSTLPGKEPRAADFEKQARRAKAGPTLGRQVTDFFNGTQ